MDNMKQEILEELLKQIHAKMGEDYETEEETEEGTCPDCGEPMCACEKEEEAPEMTEEAPEEEYTEEEAPEEEPEGDDLKEQLKEFFGRDQGPGPGTPKAALPLTSGVSVMEITASKPKKARKTRKKK